MRSIGLGVVGVAWLMACEPHSDPPRAASTATPSTTPTSTSTSTSTTTPSESTTPPPPYDLAADRARIIDEAQHDLGKGATIAVVADIFVLIGAPGWGPGQLRTSVKLVEDALAAYFNGRFRQRPTQAIAVYLFPTAAPYTRYCRAKWNEDPISRFGFYRPDERRMVMNAGPGLGTLTHELVHPIVDADFPQAPTWINEGIASLYEGFILPAPGEIRGVKNWRYPRLRTALDSPAERNAAALDKLFGMPDDTFRGDAEDLNYAMARYACQWLDGKRQLWPFYHLWRDHYATDPTGEKSFAEVTGMTPAEASRAWVTWTKAL